VSSFMTRGGVVEWVCWREDGGAKVSEEFGVMRSVSGGEEGDSFRVEGRRDGGSVMCRVPIQEFKIGLW
jgi:hypothetical protein